MAVSERESNIGYLFQFGDLFVSPDGKVRQVDEVPSFEELFSKAEDCKEHIGDFFDVIKATELLEDNKASEDTSGESSQIDRLAGVFTDTHKSDEKPPKVICTYREKAQASDEEDEKAIREKIETDLWLWGLFGYQPMQKFDCHYFELDNFRNSFFAISGDVRDALIYNLKYKQRKERETESGRKKPEKEYAEETIYNTRYTQLSEKNTKFFMPFSEKDMKCDFCNYSMSALLLQDAHNNNISETGIRCFKFVKNTDDFKGRTFRKMLFSLGLDPSKDEFGEIKPQIEDRWFLEKVTGFRTTVELFPLVKCSHQWGPYEGTYLIDKFVPTIMKCKPMNVRIGIADWTVKSICQIERYALEKRNGSEEYDNSKKELLNKLNTWLEEAIGDINRNYLFSLSYLYNLYCGEEGHEDRTKSLRKNWWEELQGEQIYHNDQLLNKKCEYYRVYDREKAALWAIYFPEKMDDILSDFPAPDIKAKRYTLNCTPCQGHFELV